MKFSTLKVFQGSSVNFVIRLSNTQVSTWTTLSPLPQWAVIKNLVAHPQILAMQPKTTFQIYFKSTMTTMQVIQLQKTISKMQFLTFSSSEYSIQSNRQSTLPEDHQYDQNQRKMSCNKPQKCSNLIDYTGIISQTRFEGWISCKFITLQLSAGWLDKSSQQFLYGYDPCSWQIQFLRPPYALLCATKFMLMISNHGLLDW